MNSNWYDLTGFQRDLLQAIADLERTDTEPLSGTAVSKEIFDRYTDEIARARIYDNLDALVEAGYVVKSHVDGRTNEYGLTKEGRDILKEHACSAAESAGFGPVVRAMTDGGQR